jgi:hypothetical protein
MGHQQNGIVAVLRFFQDGAVQLRDRRIELVEQLQKFFAPPAGPGKTWGQTGRFRASLA